MLIGTSDAVILRLGQRPGQLQTIKDIGIAGLLAKLATPLRFPVITTVSAPNGPLMRLRLLATTTGGQRHLGQMKADEVRSAAGLLARAMKTMLCDAIATLRFRYLMARQAPTIIGSHRPSSPLTAPA